MKRTPRILAFSLVFALLLGCVSSALGITSDHVGLSCEEAVTELQRLGLIEGYPDGTFKPDRPITRAEIAKIFSIAKTDTYPDDTDLPSFSDISGHWAEDYIIRGAALGLILGYPDGTFAPDQDITYAETAALCTRLIGYDETVLADLAACFSKAGELGLLEGISAESGDKAVRGDVAMMLFGAMNLPIGKTTDGAFAALEPNVTYFELCENLIAFYESDVLVSAALCGYYEDNLINAAAVAEEPDLYLWNKDLGAYVSYETDDIEAAVLYNFVTVCDTDEDEIGDALFIVNRADSEARWDADMDYIPPTGDVNAFINEYNIPYGERLIGFADEDGYLDGAAYDFANIVEAGDLENSVYWAAYDWYNSTSKGSLTLLSGFRTIQQSNGWACGVTSATMVLDWFGLRGDLNELDLSALRNTKEKYGSYRFGSGTDVQMLINVFDSLNEMSDEPIWDYESTYDFVDEDGNLDDAYLSTEWILAHLEAGVPILVGWNSFGGHWQVIIGYDTMGTASTADDVLILADPYDSTDHINDGVNVQSYQRLLYDWTQNFDRDFSRTKGFGMTVVFVPTPVDYDGELAPVEGAGLAPAAWDRAADANMTDDMLLDYGSSASDLEASEYAAAKRQRGDNGLAGPASSRWYRAADYANSPYYAGYDFYNGENISETLELLKNFKTSQQASEWTCGPASLRMALEWFGELNGESEFSLSAMRDNDREGATTLDGIIAIYDALSEKYDQEWSLVTTDDLDDDLAWEGYYLEGGSEDGLIPYFVRQGIPVLIGWDEWGGHWQVIIGYDDMGTEETQDDVIILADPYDTTDHIQDGYLIESYERLVYGWGAKFDSRGSYVFAAAAPVK